LRSQETIETTMLKRSAVKNPVTKNPGIKYAARSTRSALMTKINKPSVKIVIGSVSKIRIGRTKELRIPRTIATRTTVIQLVTATPGMMYAATTTATQFTSK